MKKHLKISDNYLRVLVGALLLLGLYLASLHSYLLFHSLVEMFVIVIYFGIFAIAWNSRRFVENSYLLFVGIACLFIGGLELVHTLSYKGMGVFPGYGANLPTQLWISARGLESVSFLIAPLLLGRRLRHGLVFACYAAIVAMALTAIFYLGVFPDCYVEGKGLTLFKKISEYGISLAFLAALILLVRKKQFFDRRVMQLLAASIIVGIAAELAFTLYIDVYGFFNKIGHFLLVVSSYLVYQAIIVTALAEPYSLLFRNLKQSEEALRESEGKYRNLVERANDGITVIQDNSFRYCNQRFADILGYDVEELVDAPFAKHLHPDELPIVVDRYSRRMASEDVTPIYNTIMLRKDGSNADVEINAGLTTYQGKPADLVFFRDITERKRIERERLALTDRIRLLLESTDQGIYGIDQEGLCTFINRSAAEMLGLDAQETLGENMHKLIHHSHQDGSEYSEDDCPVHKSLRTGQGSRTDGEVFWRRDGMFFAVEYSSFPTLEGGVIKGAVVTFTDITERKRLEVERENARLALEEVYQRERRIAETLQRNFLPDATPQLDGFEFADAYYPALNEAAIGGDVYDIFRLPNGKIALVIADVSGKGLRAAKYGAMVKYMLRAYAYHTDDPTEILTKLNDSVAADMESHAFVTCFLGILDPTTREFTYANAGHDYPLHISEGFAYPSRLDSTGRVLGIDAGANYTSKTLKLMRNDILFLYTDGVTDARGVGQKMDTEGLESLMTGACALSAGELVERIMAEVRKRSGGMLADDVAIIALKVVKDETLGQDIAGQNS